MYLLRKAGYELTLSGSSHALKALKQYIVQRLAAEEFHERTENAVVTYVWIAMSTQNDHFCAPVVHEDLNIYHQAWGQPLSVEAAHAALLVGSLFDQLLPSLADLKVTLEARRAFETGGHD